MFQWLYTRYFMEIIVNAMEENPSREKIMKIWKDYAILDAIVVTETSVKRNFLVVSVAKTLLPMQGARVRSLFREPDPRCCS